MEDAPECTVKSAQVRLETPLASQVGWASAGFGLAPLLVRVLGEVLRLPKPPLWREGVNASWSLFAVAFVLWGILRTRGLRGEGTVTVEGGSLRVDLGSTQRAIPLEKLTSGVYLPGTNERAVEFTLRGGSLLRVAVKDEVEARDLLRAAGLGAASRKLRVPLLNAAEGTRASWLLAGLATVLCALPFAALAQATSVPAWSTWAWLLFSIAAASLARPLALRGSLSVGLDGVALERGLQKRFLPYEELASVRAEGGTLVLVPRSGEPLSVPLRDGSEEASTRLAQGLVARIQEARALRSDGAVPPEALLARGGRSVREWRAALEALLGRGTGYRSVGLDKDTLARVLAAPSASAEQRLGAALALAECKDEGSTTRVRVALDTSADESLGGALQAALDGDLDDAKLDAALAPRGAAASSK